MKEDIKMKTKLFILISLLLIIAPVASAQEYDNIITIQTGERTLLNVKYPETEPKEVAKNLKKIRDGEKTNDNVDNIISFIVENDNISIVPLTNSIYGFKGLKPGETEVIFDIAFKGNFVGQLSPGYETKVLIKIEGEEPELTDYEKLQKIRKEKEKEEDLKTKKEDSTNTFNDRDFF